MAQESDWYWRVFRVPATLLNRALGNKDIEELANNSHQTYREVAEVLHVLQDTGPLVQIHCF